MILDELRPGFQIFMALCIASNIPTSSCGESKIIRGKRANSTQFPFIVALVEQAFVEQGRGFATCTGVLFTRTFVITSCHCLVESDPSDPKKFKPADPTKWPTFVYSGETVWKADFTGRYSRKAVGFIVHANCTGQESIPRRWDVGVVVVDVPFELEKNRVEVIRLPSLRRQILFDLWEEFIRNGSIVQTAAFGVNKPGLSNYDLRYTYTRIRGKDYCQAIHKSFSPLEQDSYLAKYNFACGSVIDEQRPSHHAIGDSGGPVLFRNMYVGLICCGSPVGYNAYGVPIEITYIYRLDGFMPFLYGLFFVYNPARCSLLKMHGESNDNLLNVHFHSTGTRLSLHVIAGIFSCLLHVAF